jgi:hypothetical protein
MSAPLFKFKDTHSTSRRPHHRRRFLLVSMIGLLEFVMPWIALHVCIRKNDCSFSLGMFSGFGKNKIRMSRPRPWPAPMASFTGMWPMLLLLWWGLSGVEGYDNKKNNKRINIFALHVSFVPLFLFAVSAAYCSFSLGMFSGFGKNKIRMSRPRPWPAPMASFTGMWPMLLLLWWGVAVSAAYATSMCIYKFSKSNSNRTKKVRVALRRQGIALRIAITILLIFYPGKLLWL